MQTNANTLPDITAIVLAVAATAAATHWAGSVVSGTQLSELYVLILGYIFGRNVPGPSAASSSEPPAGPQV